MKKNLEQKGRKNKILIKRKTKRREVGKTESQNESCSSIKVQRNKESGENMLLENIFPEESHDRKNLESGKI